MERNEDPGSKTNKAVTYDQRLRMEESSRKISIEDASVQRKTDNPTLLELSSKQGMGQKTPMKYSGGAL